MKKDLALATILLVSLASSIPLVNAATGSTDNQRVSKGTSKKASSVGPQDSTALNMNIDESAGMNASTRSAISLFKQGKIQEAQEAADKALKESWLANANLAFQHAVELSPGLDKNHLALAAVLERQGKAHATAQELEQAKPFDTSDQMANYLSQHFTDVSLKGSNNAPPFAKTIQAVRIHADGLTCDCQATKIDGAFRDVKGIAVGSFSHIKPYDGILFVDQSVITAEKAVAEAKEKSFPSTMQLKQPVSIKIDSKESVATLDQVVKLSQANLCGNAVDFVRKFDPILSSLPETDTAIGTTGNTTETSIEVQGAKKCSV